MNAGTIGNDVPLNVEWIHAITNACQSLVGLIECGHEDDAPAGAVRACLCRVPDANTGAEERLLRGHLIEIATRWAVRAHDRVHDGLSVSCVFRVDTGFGEAWGVPDRDARAAFETWVALFFDALAATHRAPPAIRAAALVALEYRARLSVRALSRATGTHHVALRREFLSTFGMSIRDYKMRARVRAAIPMLRDPSKTTRGVADAVGYGSAKNFYRAIRAVTGRSPAALRRATDDEATAIRDAVLPAARRLS